MARDPAPHVSLSESLARMDRALSTRSLESVLAPADSPGSVTVSAALVALGAAGTVAAALTGVGWVAVPALLLFGAGGMRLVARMGHRARSGAWIGVGAEVHPSARLEAGARIEPGATVRAQARVQAGAVVRMGATIGERAIVERNAVIGWGVDVGDGAVVGRAAKIGAGTDVHTGAKIGARATVGYGVDVDAGAVVAEGAHVGTGSDVNPGAVVDAGQLLPMGSDVEANAPAAETDMTDANDARIDEICDRIEDELREVPETIGALLGDAGISGLRRTCHALAARERAIRAECDPQRFQHLNEEEQALRSKRDAAADERVRASLEGALSALSDQRAHREQLRRTADRLEAERTRLTWTLEGIGTRLVHLRAAGDAPAPSDPVLDERVRQLGEEIDAIAGALEEVSSESSMPPAMRSRLTG